MNSLADRIAKKRVSIVRPARREDADSEFDLIREILQCLHGLVLGLRPPDDNEMRDIQKNVMPFVDPDLFSFIYHDSEPPRPA